MSEAVLVEARDGVLAITWNRPEALNSLSAQMMESASDAIEGIDDHIRLIVLRGTGRAFCAGADLNGEMVGTAPMDVANRLVRALVSARVPVVAAVNGLAAGVGATIAAAADLAIATRSAYFLFAQINVGLIPDGGATEIVAASVGRARANRLVLLGERLPATEAAEAGLIAQVVDDADFDAAVTALTERMTQGPTLAYAATKEIMNATTLPHLEHALEEERTHQVRLFSSADVSEGATAFLEKRPAKFVGR